MESPEVHGQVEIGQDVLYGLGVERSDGGQGLSHHLHLDPARARAARPGRRGRGQLVAHLGLSQQPQKGFRALAVHVLSLRYFGSAADRHDRATPDRSSGHHHLDRVPAAVQRRHQVQPETRPRPGERSPCSACAARCQSPALSLSHQENPGCQPTVKRPLVTHASSVHRPAGPGDPCGPWDLRIRPTWRRPAAWLAWPTRRWSSSGRCRAWTAARPRRDLRPRRGA